MDRWDDVELWDDVVIKNRTPKEKRKKEKEKKGKLVAKSCGEYNVSSDEDYGYFEPIDDCDGPYSHRAIQASVEPDDEWYDMRDERDDVRDDERGDERDDVRDDVWEDIPDAVIKYHKKPFVEPSLQNGNLIKCYFCGIETNTKLHLFEHAYSRHDVLRIKTVTDKNKLPGKEIKITAISVCSFTFICNIMFHLCPVNDCVEHLLKFLKPEDIIIDQTLLLKHTITITRLLPKQAPKQEQALLTN